MADDLKNRPIIIKRKKVVAGDGHHGGAWKVAICPSFPLIAASFTPVGHCENRKVPRHSDVCARGSDQAAVIPLIGSQSTWTQAPCTDEPLIGVQGKIARNALTIS